RAIEFRAIPALMGEMDVIRSVLLLPGVSSTGEGAGGFNVRGGRIDQNLVLLDGAQLYNTSHLLGFFSVFNPDLIDHFTLYKGHIPARFGGRLSSVLEVDQKEGNFDEWSFSGGTGVVSSRFVLEGPIQKGKTALLLGGRAAYPTWLLQRVKNVQVRNSAASYYDTDAVINHRFNDKHQLSLAYHGGGDRFRYSDQFGTSWESHVLRARLRSLVLGNRGVSLLTAVHGLYINRLDDLGSEESGRLSNGMRYTQLREHLSFSLGERHVLNGGAEGVLYMPRDEVIGPLGPESGQVPASLSKSRGLELAAYIEDEITLSASLSASLGLRYSYFQEMGPGTQFSYVPGLPRTLLTLVDTTAFGAWQAMSQYGGLEPRISLRQSLGKNKSLKLAYNRTRQYIHLVSNTAAPTPVDIWQVSNAFIPPQIGDNLSLGYYQNFAENQWETAIEVYVRKAINLIAYKDFAQLLLNEHLETELISGEGRAYGAELLIKRTRGRLTGWLGYSYTRSLVRVNGDFPETRINNGVWFPSDFDQPHQLNIVTNIRMRRQVSMNFNAVYHTGRPYTLLVSGYYAGQTAVPNFSERNAGRIPDYFRVDYSVTFGNVFKGWKDDLTFSLYNVFARRNAYSVFYARTAGTFVRPYKLAVLGAAFPALTYNFSF
ncbi:MAG: hypothetical protein EAZ89_15435, partial [Bacteroidetes bacterium]